MISLCKRHVAKLKELSTFRVEAIIFAINVLDTSEAVFLPDLLREHAIVTFD